MAGYSGTPLQKKLGIKPGARVVFVNQPPSLRKDLGKLPDEGPRPGTCSRLTAPVGNPIQ